MAKSGELCAKAAETSAKSVPTGTAFKAVVHKVAMATQKAVGKGAVEESSGWTEILPEGTRAIRHEKIWISGVLCDVDRPLTVGAKDVLYATKEDKRAFEANRREAARLARNLLPKEEIRRIRKKKLGLTQRRASERLTYSARSFQKYESGAAIPSKAMDMLLRALDRYPGLLDEIAPE